MSDEILSLVLVALALAASALIHAYCELRILRKYAKTVDAIVAEAKLEAAYKINAAKTVAVSTRVKFNPNMIDCPIGVKLQLLGAGGVAVYSEYHGDKFWKGWSPIPSR